MPEEKEQRAEWESSRAAEPLDYPQIVFIALSRLLFETPPNSNARDQKLRELEAILSPREDDRYRARLIEIGKRRKVGRSDGYQYEWLAALMQLMKRKGLLGEDWVRG